MRQEVIETFERVRAHLLAQGKRALHGDKCAYRAPGVDRSGMPVMLTCAVGCLIADGAYDPSIEGRVAGWLDARGDRWDAADPLGRALGASGIAAVDGMREMLMAVQFIHDNREPWQWELALARLGDAMLAAGPMPAGRPENWGIPAR